MELFKVVSKSGKCEAVCSDKTVAKGIRDALNEEVKWESTLPEEDNSNTMPFHVTYGKDHWRNK